MADELINQGLELMLLGMGTVFVFLTLLVFTTSFMSKAIASWKSAERLETPQGLGDAHLRRVIAAAVAQHRKARR